MIDTTISNTASTSASLRERQLRTENSTLAQQNAQLQGENRDLRAEQRRLASENSDLQRELGDLQRDITRSDRAANPDSTSGTLLDVYA
jgi:uncharacterized protein YlxW (UPF0749 family)